MHFDKCMYTQVTITKFNIFNIFTDFFPTQVFHTFTPLPYGNHFLSLTPLPGNHQSVLISVTLFQFCLFICLVF